MTDDPVVPVRSRPHRAEIAVLAALVVAGAIWAALHLRGSYFLYDEWSMIQRVAHEPMWRGMTASFNGHLWMAQYWVYRVQVSAFGVDSHAFVGTVFVLSLVLLHLATAALLRAARMAWTNAVLVAGLLTYLGASSQNMLFAVQVSPVLSAAAGFAAAAVALRPTPSTRRAVVVGALMLSCAVIDSGVALGLLCLVAVVTVWVWRSRAVLALVPSTLVLVWWYATADLGPQFTAPLGRRLGFGWRLLLQSAGSVVDGGQVVGGLLLVAIVVILVAGRRQGLVVGPLAALAVGGVAAALVTAAGITQSRAGLAGFTFADFNRYLSNVALPLYVGVLPGVAAVVRGWVSDRQWAARPAWKAVPAVCVAVAFVLGLSPLWAYARGFTAWNRSVHAKVQAATVIVRDGCPSGASPVPQSQPAGVLSPQISTALLRELMDRGALHAPPTAAFDPNVTSAMCPAG